MSNPLDVKQILDHCMLNIEGVSEAMAADMHDAAMRPGDGGRHDDRAPDLSS